MDRDKDEQNIQELLRGRQLKNPPEELMKNYAEEVRLKIRNTPGAPVFGFPAFAVILAVSALLSGAFWWWSVSRPVVQPAVDNPAPVVTESFEQELQTVEEEADFEGLSDDLMVLELLGEDSGMTDDSDGVEADLSFFAGA